MHRHFLFHRLMQRHHEGRWAGCDDRFEGHFDGEAYQFHGRRGRHGPFGHSHDGDVFNDWNGLQGGGRRGGGRVLGHGDLKLLLLALIEQQPRHGYELIRTIEEMVGGGYSPSPGTVYPTLTMLEELGYAVVEATEGGKKRYAITPEGVTWLDGNRAEVEALMQRMQDNAHRMHKMNAPNDVRQAMHEIKHALIARAGAWSVEEAARITAILRKAAAAIASGDKP